MKGTLANKGRCPICTLKPPCKHFDSVEALSGTTGIEATPDRGYFYPGKNTDYSAS